jgi:predicted amidohydrolase
VISPSGRTIAEADDGECIVTCEVDLGEIESVRERIPYLKEYDMKLKPGGR